MASLLALLGSSSGFAQGAGEPGFDDLAAPIAEPAAPPQTLAERYEAIFRAQPVGVGIDRHQLRARLDAGRDRAGASVLVIVLEGTAAFEPRLAAALEQVRLDDGPDFPRGLGVETAKAAFETVFRRKPRWSGLTVGPLDALVRHPDSIPGGFSWSTFPSEEVEFLAGNDELEDPDRRLRNGKRLGLDVLASMQARPQGVMAARDQVLADLRAAVARGESPHLVVLSHSSGGRAAVKLAELLKAEEDPRSGAQGVTLDLVFTIDPVREAHEAVAELSAQFARHELNERLRQLGRKIPPDPLPLVHHRAQPESLYKPSNVTRWVSVYQREDSAGLTFDLVPKHGIHGSPVAGADFEEEIPGVGERGHGTITYHPRTLELWRQEVAALPAAVGPPAPAAPVSQADRASRFYAAYLRTAHRAYGEAAGYRNMGETNQFAEMLVAGARADPAGYAAFAAEVEAKDGDGRPMAGWFRHSWNEYLRTRKRAQKRVAEYNMKQLSKAMKSAF